MASEHDRVGYLMATPAGAFKAVAEPHDNRLRRFLVAMMRNAERADASPTHLCAWSGCQEPQEAEAFLLQLLNLGWVQTLDAPPVIPDAPLETALPKLLPALSPRGKILMADSMGFYLHSHGFAHEVAEELSALSADLASLHERRSGMLNRNLGLSGGAWALIDAAGHSQVGFWPIYIGKERFVLVVAGAPAFNQPQLVDLMLLLFKRFQPGDIN